VDVILPYLIVFAAMTALDFVWAFYTRAVASGHVLKGSFMASGLICLTGTAQIGYTHDWHLLAPAALGAFVGTYAALRLTKS
jgi:hypothetical protein